MGRNAKINAVDEKIDELDKQYNEEEAIEVAQQEGEKNETNNTDKTEQDTAESTSDAKSETNETSQEPGQPESTNPENEIEGPNTTEDIEAYKANVLPERDNVVVDNFKIPNWDYLGYVQEMQQFKKGLTSITGEPGWFYFKIIFHFDDTFGLLGNIIHNSITETHRGNTAIQYLTSRAGRFKKDNLKSRAIALEKFVKYLSFINSTTPWFFDKVSGLDKAILKPTELTTEKTIEISCLEDAVDMRLTTLFHLYQYVCYDEIQQKEIVPENLRKFNMSIALYHVPIRLFHTNNVSKKGTDKAKFINDTPNDFANKMSYKLFTFRGCEFDLESIGSIIPSSVDNSKPFNLGKSTIKIKYDRCFTHLMNEWEQFMLGPEGIYYDPTQLKIGNSTDQVNRLNNIINSINDETTLKNSSSSPKIIASIVGENFVRYAAPDHKLGNIYNLNIAKLKAEDLYDRTSGIYLSNLFDYNPVLFRGLVIQKNVDPSKQVLLTGITQPYHFQFDVTGLFQKVQ